MTTIPAGHDERWRDHGSCSTQISFVVLGLAVTIPFDPDIWFPDQGGGALARRICATCPVRDDCLDHAIENREEHGIWGGAGEFARRRLARVHSENRHRYMIEVDDHFLRLDEFAFTGTAPVGAAITFTAGATHGRKSTYKRGCRGALCQFSMGHTPTGLLCDEYLETLGRTDLLPAAFDPDVLAAVEAWRLEHRSGGEAA